jgi:hypothetical protein
MQVGGTCIYGFWRIFNSVIDHYTDWLDPALQQEVKVCKCKECCHRSRVFCMSQECKCCDLEDAFALLTLREPE